MPQFKEQHTPIVLMNAGEIQNESGETIMDKSGQLTPGSQILTAADLTDFDAAVDVRVSAYLLANPPSSFPYTCIQMRNTSNTQDLNASTTFYEVDMAGPIEQWGPVGDFTAVGNAIQCNFDGLIEVNGSTLIRDCAASRGAFTNAVGIDGVATGAFVNSSYDRNTGGHEETGNTVPVQTFSVTDGQLITLLTRQQAVGGAMTIDADRCLIRVKRVE